MSIADLPVIVTFGSNMGSPFAELDFGTLTTEERKSFADLVEDIFYSDFQALLFENPACVRISIGHGEWNDALEVEFSRIGKLAFGRTLAFYEADSLRAAG